MVGAAVLLMVVCVATSGWWRCYQPWTVVLPSIGSTSGGVWCYKCRWTVLHAVAGDAASLGRRRYPPEQHAANGGWRCYLRRPEKLLAWGSGATSRSNMLQTVAGCATCGNGRYC